MTGGTSRAARTVAVQLADRMPYEVAAAWVHAGALAQHATATGLVSAGRSIPHTLEALATAHPALAGLVDPAVNPAFTADVPDLTPVADLWRQHSVADPATRTDGYRLGDLYQELSDEARKGRALCQTPRFVTDLLLDLTVPDAVDAFGADLRVVDPACGTGHILIETLIRMVEVVTAYDRMPWCPDRWAKAAGMVHGVDLDPYAAQLARYRLLALLCRVGGRTWTAAQAPTDLPIQVTAVDSLLGDPPALRRGQYHVVLGNPPYITAPPATSAAIRARYPLVCHRQFSLALPFTQLMTDLAVPGGFVAQLTGNSFMKREFGRPFVERYLTGLDLRWVIDTSGAYIPGHGTPTVILVHRNQPPASTHVNVVQGKRGEPARPADPARGVVWSAIASAVRRRLSAHRFVAAGRAHTRQAATEACPAPPGRFTQPSLLDLLDAA